MVVVNGLGDMEALLKEQVLIISTISILTLKVVVLSIDNKFFTDGLLILPQHLQVKHLR
jgi:hypothetical protein